MTDGISREEPAEHKIFCVKVLSGGLWFPFPMKRLEAVRAFPVIVRVPEGPEDLVGISPYEGRLVPYYRVTSGPAEQESTDGRPSEIRCGILFQTGAVLIGIAADEISGETAISAEELEEQMPGRLWELLGGIQA